MQISNRSKRIKLAALFITIIFPVTLMIYTIVDNRNYGVISVIFIVLAMIPFLMMYEMKKPKAREWIPLAIMAAIACIGRVAFAPIPSFKPTSAIIIITAMVFGPEAGFVTGAVAAISSNLFFGQGPWTPWQMFCWGAIGFIAGILSKHNFLNEKWKLCTFGMLCGFFFGWIMNIWAATGFINEFSWKAFGSLYISSFWFDFTHGLCTVIFLYLLSDSWGGKLQRVKVKYGLMER